MILLKSAMISSRIMSIILILSSCAVSSCRSENTAQKIDYNDEYKLYEADPVENSGRVMDGEYQLKSLGDDYSGRMASEEQTVIYVFTNNGSFKRDQYTENRLLLEEEGVYLEGKQNELVLYIEKSGGRQLENVRVEKFMIEEQTDALIRLKTPSGVITLEKK